MREIHELNFHEEYLLKLLYHNRFSSLGRTITSQEKTTLEMLTREGLIIVRLNAKNEYEYQLTPLIDWDIWADVSIDTKAVSLAENIMTLDCGEHFCGYCGALDLKKMDDAGRPGEKWFQCNACWRIGVLTS